MRLVNSSSILIFIALLSLYDNSLPYTSDNWVIILVCNGLCYDLWMMLDFVKCVLKNVQKLKSKPTVVAMPFSQKW